MTSRRPAARTTLTTLIASMLAVVLLGACSSGSSDSGSTSSGDSSAAGIGKDGNAAAVQAEPAPMDSASRDATELDRGHAAAGSNAGLGRSIDLSTGAVIKTADISMQADDVGAVVAKVSALATGLGGRVSSENTSSDAKGSADNAFVTVEVPVNSFESSVDKIATFGTHVDQNIATEDVTAKLADVDSRVRSAETSITQLRRLFSRATKLGDVIALESELSQREADLEALQAQQRVLQARTTMSTISVDITLTKVAPKSTSTDAGTGGFVSGIKRGWDALVTFVVTGAHTLGLVLPIGTLLLLLAAGIWFGVRRLTPSRRTAPQAAPVASRE